MKHAESIVDALIEGAGAPVAPPKPTTTPTKTPTKTPEKPRPGTRPWNPSRRPGVSPRPKARRQREHGWVADRSQIAFAEAEGSVPVPSPEEESAATAPQPPPLQSLCDYIRPGDRVTIVTQQGQNVTGRATMRNRQAGCWVLNAGGPHGRPVIASEENIVSIRRGGRSIYGK